MLDDTLFTEFADLRAAVTDVLGRTLGPLDERDSEETRNASAIELWKHLSQMGISGLGIDEQHGGVGGGLTESAVVVRELGRVLAPRSATTSAIVARMLTPLADDRDVGELVSAVAAGTPVALGVSQFGWAPLGADWASVDLRDAGGGQLVVTGYARGVIDIDDAAVLVLVLDGDESDCPRTLLVIDLRSDDVTIDRINTAGVLRSFSSVEFDAVPATIYEVPDEAVDEAISVGRLLLAYEMLGAAEAVIAMAADYASSRKQFGQPIGSFQAVSHRLAAVFIDLQAAAASASQGLRGHRSPTFDLEARLARTAGLRCLVDATEAAMQVFGAVGFTWDHPLHHFMKYAKVCERTLTSEKGTVAGAETDWKGAY